jgi:hypothetical protein
MTNTPLRELESPTIGWAQISLGFGRDEVWSDIDNQDLVLSAAGLMVAALAQCLSKDDDWLSRNEVLRSLIPGTEQSKIEAAEALCQIGLWQPEQRGGKDGWVIGCETALKVKRQRVTNASNAARARYRNAQEPSTVLSVDKTGIQDDPFGDSEESPF